MTAAPGEWATVEVVRHADCENHASGLEPSVTVEADSEHGSATVEAVGPATSRGVLYQALGTACAPQDHQFFLPLFLTDADAPEDAGYLDLTWQVEGAYDGRMTYDVRSMSSTTPGLSVDVTGLPFSTSTGAYLRARWTVDDCAALHGPADTHLRVEYAVPDGASASTLVRLDQQTVFELGGLVTRTCGGSGGDRS